MLFGKYINKYYLRYALFFIIGIIALVTVDIAQLEVPELFGKLIDDIDKNTLTIETLTAIVKQMIVIILIMFVCRFAWRIALFGMATRLEADLRMRMFKKIETLGQDYFGENKTGAVMVLFTNDLQTIRSCFGQGTMMLIDALFLSVLTFYKMFVLNKIMAVVSLIPLLLIAFAGLFVSKFMHKKFKVRQEAFESLSDFTQENFSGISVIRAFVKEQSEVRRFSNINLNNEKANLNFIKLMIKMEVALSTAINVISLGIITSGALIIIGNPDGNFTIGNLTEYVSYFSTLIWPIMAISQLINMASQGYASLGRINKLFNEEPSVKSKENAVILDQVQGKIEFRNLSFTYPTLEHNILSNVSFSINPGEKIGIIGKTGSGKTTIVDLLLRMYNVEEGQLFIDDIDIMDLDVKHLRENITFVPQDNFLFGTKIKDNIAFGQDAAMEEVERVSKMADIHKDIVDFTDGYDTILGERGVTVSGGQKQRISIARALLKKAPIIILDDAVSAVDTKTEDNILNNLKAHYQDATIIITAHRISTVQDLDKVLVIEEGQVVGFGTHDDLYANNEIYKEMVDLQRLEAKIEGDLNGTN